MERLSGADLPVTDRTRHRRLREQGSTSRADLDAILRAGFVCHLGVLVDGVPIVAPTVYGTDGDTIYLHGSVATGELPLRHTWAAPVPDPALPPGLPAPPHIAARAGRPAG